MIILLTQFMTFVFSQLAGIYNYMQLIRNRWPPRKRFQFHRWRTRCAHNPNPTFTEIEPNTNLNF